MYRQQQLHGLKHVLCVRQMIIIIDFVINRFFMKLFETNNLVTVTYCHICSLILTCQVFFWKRVMFLLENIDCAE